MPFVFKQANSNGTDGTSAATIAATLTSPTAGAMVVGQVTWGSSTTTHLSSITDNGTGGTWVILRRTNDATNGACAATIYGYGWSSMPTTVTANFSPSQGFRSITIQEFTGQISGDPIDGTNEQGRLQASPGTGTDGASSGTGTLTPSVDGCLVFGCTVNTGALGGGSSEHTAGTNFTEPANAEYAASGQVSCSSEYEIQTSAAARNASFTLPANNAHITSMMIFKPAESATPVEQASFRWGLDDGNEASHGWAAAQNTNLQLPNNNSRLIRFLLDATGDPAAFAPTLRFQKNGSGGYTVVPVGTTTTTSPPTAPTATVTTVGTAADPWTINRPAASTGDMVVFVLAWDDSTDVTTVTAPSGVNGETAVSIAGPIGSNSGGNAEMRQQAWYYIATGAWTTGTLSFDPSASETVRAVAYVIPAGQFNASDPIGFSNTLASTGTAESNVNSPTGTAEGDDGSGRLYIAFGSDADALTAPGSNWNTINNATGGGVGLCVGSRDALVSNSESITALTATIASDSWTSLCFVVKPNVANNEVYITTSANIAAGGEATTNRLIGGTGSFVTGRRWDDENGSDSIDITTDNYTEVEWLVALSSAPANADYFDFQVYQGSSPLTTYAETPRWTIPGGNELLPRGLIRLVAASRASHY